MHKEKEIIEEVNKILLKYNLKELNIFIRQYIKLCVKEFRRWDSLMKDYNPNDEDVKKIINMIDGLYNRFRDSIIDLVSIKKDIDNKITNGELFVSDYQIRIKYYFGYTRNKGIKTADIDTLLELSDRTDSFFPIIIADKNDPSEFDYYWNNFIESNGKLSWNIEKFNIPGLEEVNVPLFMHNIFIDARTFCPIDIRYLIPEDLNWSIIVEYDNFSSISPILKFVN